MGWDELLGLGIEAAFDRRFAGFAYLKSGGVRVLFRVFENLRHGPRNDAPAWRGEEWSGRRKEEWSGRRKDGISNAKRARLRDHSRHINS